MSAQNQRSVSPSTGSQSDDRPQRKNSSKKKTKKEKMIIPRDEVPPEVKGTQRAMQVHICVAMGQTSGSAPPLTPSEELKAKFDKSFPTKQSFSSITRSIGKPDPQQDHRERIKDVRKLHNNTAATGNSLAKDVARVEDKTFSLLYTMLDQYKLDEFMPDLIGSQSSRYNNAHRTFAIDSFQQACAGGGYRNFEVLQEYCNDNKTMARIYDSYVFGTLHERARKEARDPGYWVRRNDSNGVGKRKRALALDRETFLIANGHLNRTVKAISGRGCTSEDEGPVVDDQGKNEWLNNRSYYHIREVPGRSKLLTELLHEVDDEIEKRGRAGSMVEPVVEKKGFGASSPRRQRVVPDTPINLSRYTLPKDVPIDFFEPAFFNSLSIQDRAKYAYKPYTAFPRGKSAKWLLDNPKEWAYLSNEEFKKKHSAHLSQYEIPTQEEIDNMGKVDEAEAEEDRERAEYQAQLEADFAARMKKSTNKKRSRDDEDDEDDPPTDEEEEEEEEKRRPARRSAGSRQKSNRGRMQSKQDQKGKDRKGKGKETNPTGSRHGLKRRRMTRDDTDDEEELQKGKGKGKAIDEDEYDEEDEDMEKGRGGGKAIDEDVDMEKKAAEQDDEVMEEAAVEGQLGGASTSTGGVGGFRFNYTNGTTNGLANAGG